MGRTHLGRAWVVGTLPSRIVPQAAGLVNRSDTCIRLLTGGF
jgi:hypothetical protein